MSLDTGAVLDAIASHAMTLGLFETVNMHEVVSAPGHGLHAEIWAASISPVPVASGLQRTSAVVVWTVRIRGSADAQPRDMIDPHMMAAVDALIGAYSGDFDLGGLVRNVDLLGQASTGLGARAGYLEQDRKTFRIYDITLPMVINDVWEQVP
ncbi:hypothetical protein ABZW11_17170 [Nonomuraea sp. NPDC004580]|uniref:hypothetical protein n=1 Tax=Nonomuraea sp. NPDC004580 TaxID=3154552 RepID=UPI0033A1D2E5